MAREDNHKGRAGAGTDTVAQTDTRAPSGASPGLTPNTATFWPLQATTARSSSGASSRAHGRASSTLPCTRPRSTSCPGPPTSPAACWHAPRPTATSLSSSSKTTTLTIPASPPTAWASTPSPGPPRPPPAPSCQARPAPAQRATDAS